VCTDCITISRSRGGIKRYTETSCDPFIRSGKEEKHVFMQRLPCSFIHCENIRSIEDPLEKCRVN